MKKFKSRFPLASSVALATILITATSTLFVSLMFFFTDRDCLDGVEEACNTPGLLAIPFIIGVWGTILAYSVLFPTTIVVFIYELIKGNKKPKKGKKKKK